MNLRSVGATLICLAIYGCSDVDDRLMGVWKTDSEFYSARYQIHLENDSIRGEVLHYNDGTTIFKKAENDRRFIFKHLIKEDDTFVDAVSGATSTTGASAPQMWSITIEHEDTLAIGQKIGRQTRTEIWTRIKD